MLFLVGGYLLDTLINYHAQNFGIELERNAIVLAINPIVMMVLIIVLNAKFARIPMLHQTFAIFAEGQIKTNIKIALVVILYFNACT
jgi:hypothetical protein